MEKVRDVMSIINMSKGNIHPDYDMEKEDFEVIIQNSSNTYDLVYNGFRLGYAQRGLVLKQKV